MIYDLFQQRLRLNNERFSVCEVLFHPSDVGIDQMGLAEAVVHCVESCPEEAKAHLYSNILLTGGSALFPGMIERLTSEVRSSIPDIYELNISLAPDPITYSWEGGIALRMDPEFYSYVVSKEEYEEEGITICMERFDTLF